jgi:hypothetical protein
MAKISYQNPVEKTKLHKRSELLKKSARVLSDKLSRFGVQAVPLDNGQGEISNIKIEFSEKTSPEDVVKIKETIIETGRFAISPKEKYLLVSINIENIDSFGRGGAKEVVVPLVEKKTPVGLERDPLIVRKASTWAEKLGSENEAVSVSSNNSNPNKGIQNVSSQVNILEPIVLADPNEQKLIKQTQIQTIQNKEEMNKTKQKEILEQGKEFLRSLGITWGVTGFRSRTGTMVINIIDGDGKAVKAIEKQAKGGVELKGKAVHFSEDFSYESKSSGGGAKEKKTRGPNKKTSVKAKSSQPKESPGKGKDQLDRLLIEFNSRIREVVDKNSGPDLAGASAKFEEVFPGKTLWLQDGESSKKISIESLLKKLLS